jgi:hypothetical protein
MSSYQDKLASASARVRRKLFDHSVLMKGRQVNVTRFYITEDIYADEQVTKISSSNVVAIIVYPPGEIPLQRFRTSDNTEKVDDTGTFFFDVLPIEIYTRWADNIEIGDLVLHVIKDENGKKMGILLKISNMFGAWDTELVWRKGWAAPFSGDVPEDVQASIDAQLQD